MLKSWVHTSSQAQTFPSLIWPDGSTVHLEPGQVFDYDFGDDGPGNPWIVEADPPAKEDPPARPTRGTTVGAGEPSTTDATSSGTTS